MREAVIVAATRSAVGKAYKGTLAESRPDDMAASVVRGLLERVPDLDPKLIEDLILGCAFPEGEAGMNFARQVIFLSGLPDQVPAVTQATLPCWKSSRSKSCRRKGGQTRSTQ